METPEIGLGPRIDVINDYLDTSIEEVEQLIQTLPGDESHLGRTKSYIPGYSGDKVIW